MLLPPASVLDAFGVCGRADPLVGGEGHAVRVGHAVLKPVAESAFHTWAATIFSGLVVRGVRISRPIASLNGNFVEDGWGATVFEPGTLASGRWHEKRAAGSVLHDALLSCVPPPMPPTESPWERAHAVVWREAPVPPLERGAASYVGGLVDRAGSGERGTNVVHSDLCGNTLFADGRDPLVIDFSPTLASPSYADAILVADAIAWEGAPLELAHDLLATNDGRADLVRAIAFRFLAVAFHPNGTEEAAARERVANRPLLEAIDSTARSGP